MKSCRLKQHFLLLLMTLLLFAPIVYAKTQKVLVLHSYHQGLEWTDSISEGIRFVLAPRHKDVEIYFEYLDTKRNTGTNYSKKLLALFRAKEGRLPFDLIITSDNNALEFVRLHGKELYPDTPVVFSGINLFQPNLIDGISQVTGIVEEPDIRSTLDLMLKVHPEKKKILIVNDNTPTGLAIRKTVEAIEPDYSGRTELEYYSNFTWDSLEAELSQIGSEYLVYLLAMTRDANHEFASYLDSLEVMSQVTKVPIYGSWDFYMDKGILGGVVISGFEQGKLAAQLASRILAGESAEHIPVIKDNFHQTMFDFNIMKQFDIKMRQLPEDAIVINRPKTILEELATIPNIVLIPLITAIILLICVLILLKIRQRLILKANISLDLKVQEKTQRLNRSNAKLNRLIKELEHTNTKLQNISVTDPLTGIYNRRFISQRLTHELNSAKRYHTPLSLIMLDIDHFKKLNDTYGHPYGDTVLQKICQTISRTIREGDVFSRYGGEEFLLILPQTSYNQAQILAERVRDQVESLHWSKKDLKVTISAGVTEYIDQKEDELLHEVDVQLYQAKSEGRNRVC